MVANVTGEELAPMGIAIEVRGGYGGRISLEDVSSLGEIIQQERSNYTK